MVTGDGLAKIVDFGIAKAERGNAWLDPGRGDGQHGDTCRRNDVRQRAGNRRLHVARAGERAAGGLSLGSVRPGTPDLRARHAYASVRARDDGAVAGGDHR